jgi:hypothetical protein
VNAFRDGIRELCHNVRQIPGNLGMRPYAVKVVQETWSGAERGQGTPTRTPIPIVEANGQNPKVRQLNTEELALGGYGKGTWKIGPITPDFPGGGTLRETLQPDLLDNTLLWFELTGPGAPEGKRFTLVDITDHRAFHYTVVVTEAAENVRG